MIAFFFLFALKKADLCSNDPKLSVDVDQMCKVSENFQENVHCVPKRLIQAS